ncbi:CDPK-related kinase 2 [Raphanus sativus]|uniref:non-specific serine/threonine protein kinase n=1 Tax=Raphanus sativus TaxID=3726 RepID=A0A6J0JXI2_RAPSA|nr:CDPK-related kinase 2 [Raphanus sativus]XP_056854533.1 CDPK-related kinase 2 [Raphanus sativus]KAJ4869927.1 CDPK-related kinase 2 [Raphanus sativus]KAJ4886909.1 CDPK-related kinase 2 [Raphanus sativus]
MGGCTSKPSTSVKPNPYAPKDTLPQNDESTPARTSAAVKASPFFPFYTPSPAKHRRNKSHRDEGGEESKSVTSTPLRQLARAFHPPSPAKHIRDALRRRKEKKEAALPAVRQQEEEEREEVGLDKRFGFAKDFKSRMELGEEIGRGHFGYTCSAKFKRGEFKDHEVAVKVIPKSKMTTAISIEDVRREVKILRALSGHNNLVQFYDAFEDNANVYIVMELCGGGELLDRILARGGKYSEDDAKAVLIQILNVVAFCHLQGVVHRDLKPENFLYTSMEENSQLKVIDFGLSDFVRPDERLNDIVGSAYYVAPEVLHRSYTTEADVWSIGVIAYILLCGSRPFWARTESGIFRAVLKADPSFDEPPWPSLSSEAKDFVKRLLYKDPRKRMTASQALMHPWISGCKKMNIPFDILIFRQIKAYLKSSSLRKAALMALSKTLITDELLYLKAQFAILAPNKNGLITLDNIRTALATNATEAMKESRIPDFLALLNGLQYRGMDFEEFCAASISVHQHESLDCWEQSVRHAYELFDMNGNRVIVIEELASELGVGSSIPVHTILHDWIRHSDGKLSFLGFVKLLRGVSTRQPLAKTR